MPIKINELVFHIKVNDMDQPKENTSQPIVDTVATEQNIRLIQKDLLEFLEDQKTR